MFSPYLIALSVAVSAIAFLFRNIFESGLKPMEWFLKDAIFVLVAFIAILIAFNSLSALKEVYSIMWGNLNVERARLIPFPGPTGLTEPNSAENGIVQFIILSGYFGACAMLLATLMVRIGMMLLIIPLLPVFTVLSGIGYLRRYAKILWEIFIEFSMFPFLALLSIYLSEMFRYVAPLQIALILIPSLVPGYLFFSGRGPGTTPLLNILGGFSAGAIAGSLTGYGRSAMEIGTGNLQDGLLRMIQIPSGNSSFRPVSHTPSKPDPYREAVQEELKWRRYPD